MFHIEGISGFPDSLKVALHTQLRWRLHDLLNKYFCSMVFACIVIVVVPITRAIVSVGVESVSEAM